MIAGNGSKPRETLALTSMVERIRNSTYHLLKFWGKGTLAYTHEKDLLSSGKIIQSYQNEFEIIL